jgi:hypothetical protein
MNRNNRPRHPWLGRYLVKSQGEPAPNQPIRARRLYPGAPRVSLRSHNARSAQPHCPRQRTRANPRRGLALSARATSQIGDR